MLKLWFILPIVKLKSVPLRQCTFKPYKNNGHVDFNGFVVQFYMSLINMFCVSFPFLFSMYCALPPSGYIYVISTIDNLNALIACSWNIKKMFEDKKCIIMQKTCFSFFLENRVKLGPTSNFIQQKLALHMTLILLHGDR